MDVPDRPTDLQIDSVLMRLKHMREKSKVMQQDLAELEDLVRRYCVGENAPPQSPARESQAQN